MMFWFVSTLLVLAVVAIVRESPVVAIVLAGIAMVLVLFDHRR